MKRIGLSLVCVLLVGWFCNVSLGDIFTKIKFGKKESTRIEREAVGDQFSINSNDADVIKPMGEAKREASKVFPNGVHLEAPEGKNMVAVPLLFKIEPTAVAIKVSIQYKGTRSDSSNGRLIFVYAEKSDKQEVIGDQNDLAKDFSTIEYFFAEPASKFVNSDGLMEIHITASDGQVVDIGTVSVESLQEKPVEIRTRKVVEYQYYPVDYRQDDIFYYYYVGPRYVYCNSVTVVYTDWWLLDSYRIWRINCEPRYVVLRPVHEIYYCTSPNAYQKAHYVSYNNDGYSKWAKVSEWRAMAQQGRSVERSRSVMVDTNKRSVRTAKDNQGVTYTPNGQTIYSVDSQSRNIGQARSGEKQRRTPIVRMESQQSNVSAGNGIFDRIKTKVKNSVESVIVVRNPQGSSGSSWSGESIFQKHRSETPQRDNTPSLRSDEVRNPRPVPPAEVQTHITDQPKRKVITEDDDKDKKTSTNRVKERRVINRER